MTLLYHNIHHGRLDCQILRRSPQPKIFEKFIALIWDSNDLSQKMPPPTSPETVFIHKRVFVTVLREVVSARQYCICKATVKGLPKVLTENRLRFRASALGGIPLTPSFQENPVT